MVRTPHYELGMSSVGSEKFAHNVLIAYQYSSYV